MKNGWQTLRRLAYHIKLQLPAKVHNLVAHGELETHLLSA